MPLYRIIYASRAGELAREDLEAIQSSSTHNNPSHFVSGMLLFDNDCFLQLLEGSRRAVSSVFIKICGDKRHSDIQILTCGPIENRIFPDWNMHYISSHGEHERSLRRYLSGAVFDPFEMSVASVERLCVDTAAQATRRDIERSLTARADIA